MSQDPIEVYEGNEPYSFISYSHTNESEVFPIVQHLHAEGIRIWIDFGIHAGAEWEDKIAQRVSESSHVIYFVTKDSIESRHCRDEIALARKLDKAIIPVRLDDQELPLGLSMALGRLQHIEAFRLSPDQIHRHLTAAISQAPGAQKPLKPGQGSAPPRITIPDNRNTIFSVQNYATVGVLTDNLNGSVDSDDLLPLAEELSAALGRRKFQVSSGEVAPLENKTHFLLRTRVRRAGDNQNLNVTLTLAENSLQVWTKSYDLSSSFDIYSLAENIAQIVAGRIDEFLTRSTADQLHGFRGFPSEVVDLYFDAVALARSIQEGEPGDINVAIDMMAGACQLAPDFAAGWERLANLLLSPAPLDTNRYMFALGAINRAIELNKEPTIQNLVQKGQVHLYLNLDYAEAERTFKQALTLPGASSFYPIHTSLARIALREERNEDAIRHMIAAESCHPRSTDFQIFQAQAENILGNHAAALEVSDRTLNMLTKGRSRAEASREKIRALLGNGNDRAAADEIRAAWEEYGSDYPSHFVGWFSAIDDQDSVNNVLALKPRMSVTDLLAIGDDAGALATALEQINRGNAPLIDGIRSAYWLQELRSNPGFQRVKDALAAIETYTTIW